MIQPDEIEAAANRVGPHVRRTDLMASAPMSDRHGADIFVKCEHRQHTGSFKVRGSANYVHGLDDETAAKGVITASSGNHGIGVATAAASRGIASTIFLPASASPSKVALIQRLGAQIVTVDGSDTELAEQAARAHADDLGVGYLSPYNDPAVVAGQGTIGKEILQQAPRSVDFIVVSVGGGGLISGIASWVKSQSPTTHIVGASALNDRAMAASIEAGAIVTPAFAPTFSDGTAGAVEDGSITFDMCRNLVDSWVDVTEHNIASAVSQFVDDHHELVEGAAGVALAAATGLAAREPGATIVAVSCGGNVSANALRAMLEAADA